MTIGMFFFLLKGRSGQLKKLGFSHLYIEFPEKKERGLRKIKCFFVTLVGMNPRPI